MAEGWRFPAAMSAHIRTLEARAADQDPIAWL
jgi:hypothetical protein